MLTLIYIYNNPKNPKNPKNLHSGRFLRTVVHSTRRCFPDGDSTKHHPPTLSWQTSKSHSLLVLCWLNLMLKLPYGGLNTVLLDVETLKCESLKDL